MTQVFPHSVSEWPCCPEPVKGKYVERTTWNGLELGRLDDEPGWRVIVADDASPVDRIEITAGEGRGTAVGRMGIIKSMNDGPAYMRRLADRIDAPKPGQGYCKCDVSIYWMNGESYEYRYDLNSDGSGDGRDFVGNFRQRVFFYAGLKHPLHITPDQYEQLLADSAPLRDYCRKILSTCQW